MKEDLIQFVWRSKLLFSKNLRTTTGESIEILNTGNLNTNQGPDFLFAKIKIDEILWVGHVEIHVKSSDWNMHQHEDDPNYQNTILHVVWIHDKEINWSGRIIPSIELKDWIHPDLLSNYEVLMNNQQRIPCQHLLGNISQLVKSTQIERMMMERMEEKTEKCKTELAQLQWNWEAILFHKIAHYIVAPVNSDAMDQLCQRLPYELIIKLIHDPFQLAAMFLGTAGFLEDDSEDDYRRSLFMEFIYLQKKFGIHSMSSFEWKLLRLRPSHFPPLRIAQLCSLLSNHQGLFSQFLEVERVSELYELLEGEPPEYWNIHYMFGKKTAKVKKPSLGRQTKDIIIINAICPLLFAYGSIYGKDTYMEKAINYLQKIKPERNHIGHMWKNFNFVFNHAGHSQGGIHLFQNYCTYKKCTSCSIGNEILKTQFQ
jgi:hypothetical protein